MEHNQEIVRVRTPRGREVIGVIEEMLGGGRFRVSCTDNNSRICKAAGRFKRKRWIKPGNVVIIEPWEIESDEKGNIIWKYTKAQTRWLQKKGFLEGL